MLLYYVTDCSVRDLLSDGNLINAIKKISEEPLPYFVQYTQRDRNTGGQAHARHSYAAALEQLSRAGGTHQQQPVLQDEQVQQQQDDISEGYNISQKSGDNTTVKCCVYLITIMCCYRQRLMTATLIVQSV